MLPGLSRSATPAKPIISPSQDTFANCSPEMVRKIAIQSGSAAIIRATMPEGT